MIRARTNTTLLPPFPAAFDTLCDIFLCHFDDATPLLTKSLKDLLANTLAVAALPGIDAARDVARTLAVRGLAGVSASEGRKGGYYALEIAVKRGLGAGWLLEYYAGGAHKLVSDMLNNLMDWNLGPAIGKVVIALLSARRKEILAEGRDEKEWYAVWEKPLRDALRSDELRQRVVVYILHGVLQPSAQCFREFAQSLGLSEDDDIRNDESVDLGALLCVLKAGKELGFVGEIGRLRSSIPESLNTSS